MGSRSHPVATGVSCLCPVKKMRRMRSVTVVLRASLTVPPRVSPHAPPRFLSHAISCSGPVDDIVHAANQSYLLHYLFMTMREAHSAVEERVAGERAQIYEDSHLMGSSLSLPPRGRVQRCHPQQRLRPCIAGSA
jgi:hypothetical protein